MPQINSAESNRASLRYIKESTWGTTPGSGVSRELRITKSDLAVSKDTKISEEIRADRMVPSVIEVGAMTGGKISGEFSAGTWDDLLEGFLLGDWTLDMTFFSAKGTGVDVASTSTITIAGVDATGWLASGQYIKLEGFTTPGNNGYFQLSGAPAYSGGTTTLTVTGTPLTVEAGTAYSKVLDARDVILLSNATAFTSGNTINGGGANSFAGKTLYVGQKIYVEGLGKGSGTIVCEATNATDGDTITLTDGVSTLIFELHSSSASVQPGNIYIANSATEATLASNIAAAVMAQFAKGAIRVSASSSTATVTLTNHRGAGGTISASDDGTSVTVTNFSGGSATKSGFFTIAALPNDDTIVVEETLSTDANGSGLLVVIKGSHLRNPGTISQITKQSFTFETGFTDVEKYFVHRGQRVGSFSLKMESGNIVEVEVELQGSETTTHNATVLGATGTYTVLGTTGTEIMNATANVDAIYKDGVVLDAALRSVTFDGDSNLREQPAVGSRFPAGIGYGRFSLTGKMVAYFESFDFYNDFINHTTTSLGLPFEDADFNTYWFRVPALKVTSDPISPPGIDRDVMEEMDFTAQRDTTLNTQFMVDRFSSVFPMSDA